MFVHRREGVIVKLRRDLLEAWRVTALFRVGGQESQNLPLAFCERHILFSAAGLRMDRSVHPTEHLPKFYVNRRSPEAQAFSVWIPPAGTLGELTDEARARAATLAARTDELRSLALGAPPVPSFRDAL